jgi:hypothetical protein
VVFDRIRPYPLLMAYLISNHRLGDARSVALSGAMIDRLFAVLVATGEGRAAARWERELVAWLGARRGALRSGQRPGLDLSEIAWTPERFPEQQAFLLTLIEAAAAAVDRPEDRGSERNGERRDLRHALDDLARLVADYPRDTVVVGRRWSWDGGAPALR